jgi:thymidylate kinase
MTGVVDSTKGLETRILSTVFDVLNKAGVDYCVVNNYENLPDSISTDVDMAIDSRTLERLDALMGEAARESGAEIIQKIWHGYQKCAYILSPLVIGARFRVQLDFFTDFSAKGYPILMKNDVLLRGRRPFRIFSIPAPEAEAMFLLMRRIVKNDMSISHIEKLRSLVASEPKKIEKMMTEVFGSELWSRTVGLIESGKLEPFNDNLMTYRRVLRAWSRRGLSMRPRLKYSVSQLVRVFHRLRYPVGLSVVFLGPDGSGKSTIANLVLERVSGSFHGGRVQYWRPYLLPAMGRLKFWNPGEEPSVNPRPHDHVPQNPVKSLIRFLFYFVDYLAGYPIKVYLRKVKKQIIVFDRYYYDYLVDLQRYQFNIPAWLPRLLLFFVPAPDMTIYLDGDPSELMQRKQELSFAELSRQVAEFRNILPCLPQSIRIGTGRPIEEIVGEISQLILEKKARQTARLLSP